MEQEINSLMSLYDYIFPELAPVVLLFFLNMSLLLLVSTLCATLLIKADKHFKCIRDVIIETLHDGHFRSNPVETA